MGDTAFGVQGLEITKPDGDLLFEDVSFDIKRGEIVLLAGESGSGKSTLLRFLAGLLDISAKAWSVSGEVYIDGNHYRASDAKFSLGGYIFQNAAVFDELTVGNNKRIAKEHRIGDARIDNDLVEFVAKDIPDDQMASSCSGGQKQRVSIARTLLSGREVLFFDEPNAGLDAARTRDLCLLIRHIAKGAGKTVVIVAHHYHRLLEIVDRVLLVDGKSNRVVEFEKPDAARLESFFLEKSETPPTPPLEDAGIDGEIAQGATGAVAKPFWLFQYFLHYFHELLFSPAVLLYIVLGGVLTGFVSTWFLFQHFPYRNILTPLVHDSTLSSLGFVQFRILVPLVTAMLLASRNSAIIAADLGHRVYSSQIEVMKNLRIPYNLYLAANIVVNMVLACALLNIFSYLLCAFATMETWGLLFPNKSISLWKAAYFIKVFPSGFPTPEGAGWIFSKMILSGLAVGAVGCLSGMRAKESVLDLNRAIAWSIIWSTSLVLIIHSALTMLEVL